MTDHPFRRKMDWAVMLTMVSMVAAFILFTVKIINAHEDILVLKQAIYDMKEDVKFIKNRVR